MPLISFHIPHLSIHVYIICTVSICTIFIHPRRSLCLIYLPGRSLISASSEHAVSRTVHLPRLQLWGKRDSRDQSEDQRSVVAWRLSVCLSACLPAPSVSVMSVCLTGCEPPQFTFLFLPLASYDRLETETGFNAHFVPVKITLISRYETGYHLGFLGVLLCHDKTLSFAFAFQRLIFWDTVAEWTENVSVLLSNWLYWYLSSKGTKLYEVEYFQYFQVLIHLWQMHSSFQVFFLFLQSTFRTNTCEICKYSTVYHWITPTQHCIIHCGIYFWLSSCTPTPTPTADFLRRTGTRLKHGAWGTVLFWHNVSRRFHFTLESHSRSGHILK